MHTLIALLLAAAAACAIARPPRPTAPPLVAPQLQLLEPDQPEASYLPQFVEPKIEVNPYFVSEDRSLGLLGPSPDSDDWSDSDIYRMKQRRDDYPLNSYDSDYLGLLPSLSRLFEDLQDQVDYEADPVKYTNGIKPLPLSEPRHIITPSIQDHQHAPTFQVQPKDEQRKLFALTPSDPGYYDVEDRPFVPGPKLSPIRTSHHVAKPIVAMIMEPPRQIRQNPNLSKQKHLVPDSGKLNMGMYDMEGIHEMSHHGYVDSASTVADGADSIYGVALMAAVGAALTMAVVGFGFGWYTLSKKAKAAADVDYPAYGVTGPTVDSSGDRKLAHSAHMYHYQHQKQQIIAMERNGLDQRAGSVSDPESEEENEEGDYTVYECPGFATTGEIEVQNPLFSEDPTPPSSGKCEVVKPKP